MIRRRFQDTLVGSEVEDSVDFLRSGDMERGLTDAASRLSEPAFAEVWESPDDGDYDRL